MPGIRLLMMEVQVLVGKKRVRKMQFVSALLTGVIRPQMFLCFYSLIKLI
jgi:hypothetical protein